MAIGGRTYGDACAAAHALDLVGERWALLIVRELLFGPKRFTDLQAGLRNLRPNVLSQRLRELEHARIIRRRRLGPPAPAWVYELTEWGRELEPVLVTLGRWGRQSPFLQRDANLSVDSLMLAMQSHFDGAKARGLDATCLLAIGEGRFTVRISQGCLAIAYGEPAHPDVAVYTDPETFRALVIEGLRPSQAVRDDRLQLSGDIEALNRLLGAVT